MNYRSLLHPSKKVNSTCTNFMTGELCFNNLIRKLTNHAHPGRWKHSVSCTYWWVPQIHMHEIITSSSHKQHKLHCGLRHRTQQLRSLSLLQCLQPTWTTTIQVLLTISAPKRTVEHCSFIYIMEKQRFVWKTKVRVMKSETKLQRDGAEMWALKEQEKMEPVRLNLSNSLCYPKQSKIESNFSLFPKKPLWSTQLD